MEYITQGSGHCTRFLRLSDATQIFLKFKGARAKYKFARATIYGILDFEIG